VILLLSYLIVAYRRKDDLNCCTESIIIMEKHGGAWSIAWSMEHGAWNMEHGAQSMEHRGQHSIPANPSILVAQCILMPHHCLSRMDLEIEVLCVMNDDQELGSRQYSAVLSLTVPYCT
jgi:hypothetical protein